MKSLRMFVLATVALLVAGCGGGPNYMELAIHSDDAQRAANLLHNGSWSKWNGRVNEAYYQNGTSLLGHAIYHGSCNVVATFLAHYNGGQKIPAVNLWNALFENRAKRLSEAKHQDLTAAERVQCARAIMEHGGVHPDEYRTKDAKHGVGTVLIEVASNWRETLTEQQRQIAIRDLLHYGADPNFVFDNGYTNLHSAAGWGDRAFTEALIDAGADVNARDPIDGNTPLHMVKTTDRAVKIALINAGASETARNKAGEIPATASVAAQRAADVAADRARADREASQREAHRQAQRDADRERLERDRRRESQRELEVLSCGLSGDCDKVIHY